MVMWNNELRVGRDCCVYGYGNSVYVDRKCVWSVGTEMCPHHCPRSNHRLFIQFIQSIYTYIHKSLQGAYFTCHGPEAAKIGREFYATDTVVRHQGKAEPVLY